MRIRIDCDHCFDLTRWALIVDRRQVLTLDSLADLRALAEEATEAVALAELCGGSKDEQNFPGH
jgi:hypothetical protein